VRMTLTPAIMALLGDKAWWMPKWLDRLTPNMDVEGAALSEKIQHERESAGCRLGQQTQVTSSSSR
jgi:predicted drug exporter of the RND superfamily